MQRAQETLTITIISFITPGLKCTEPTGGISSQVGGPDKTKAETHPVCHLGGTPSLTKLLCASTDFLEAEEPLGQKI